MTCEHIIGFSRMKLNITAAVVRLRQKLHVHTLCYWIYSRTFSSIESRWEKIVSWFRTVFYYIFVCLFFSSVGARTILQINRLNWIAKIDFLYFSLFRFHSFHFVWLYFILKRNVIFCILFYLVGRAAFQYFIFFSLFLLHFLVSFAWQNVITFVCVCLPNHQCRLTAKFFIYSFNKRDWNISFSAKHDETVEKRTTKMNFESFSECDGFFFLVGPVFVFVRFFVVLNSWPFYSSFEKMCFFCVSSLLHFMFVD